MRDYVDYAYYVSLGLMCHWDFHRDLHSCVWPFHISLCVLGSFGEFLMNYEGIMYIRYIPKIHNIHDLNYRHHNKPNMLCIHNTHKHDNIHNQHKKNIINIIYIKYFSIHKLHIINLIDTKIIICIIKLCIPRKN